MSEEQLETANLETPNDETELEKLRQRTKDLSQSVERLEAKRHEALAETKKLRRVGRVLKSIGIDVEDDDAETLLAEKLLTQIEDEPAAAQTQTQAQAPASPESQVNPINDIEVKNLRKQVALLTEQQKAAEKERDEAFAKNRSDKIERVVVEALQKAGAANPQHAYRLMLADPRFKVDLSEDGSTVLGGPDYDPKPLADVVNAFRDDDSFSYMFAGSGVTGSGLGTSGGRAASNGATANNPFRTDTLNVTKGAQLFQSNPEKAKRLIAEARSIGKLDAKFAALLK
tara:strand:+ start:2592 stop:3449 length:858 start_codon:yes stop_codon:yes gene_type:complete